MQNRLPYPISAMPVRGGGSHEVKCCRTEEARSKRTQDLCEEFPIALLEEFPLGKEASMIVLRP
jgi:hypothetical protein